MAGTSPRILTLLEWASTISAWVMPGRGHERLVEEKSATNY
jgi:hypothetical protein